MKKCFKKKLDELNNVTNNRRRKTATEPILLFIAQVVAETNGNIKWLCWIAGIGIAAGITILIALAIRGL